MPDPPPRVYARQLLPLGYGYPLWTPESSHRFLRYREDGLRIGDVGVIVPENGSFDVFFNICLPHDHPFHRVNGVPDNFVHINLNDLDVAIYPYAENAGSVISTSSVTTLRTVEPSDGAGAQNALTYEFNLSSNEGALLILPDGAESYTLLKRKAFRDVAAQNGLEWYNFAEQRLGRLITHDSLYLITGYYKSPSWSVAAFHEASSQTGATEFPAQFKAAGQTRQSNISSSTAYTWETARAMHWRVGPLGDWSAFPNQSVFISGFKIAIRDKLLGRKRVEVEVDPPPSHTKDVRLYSTGKGHSRAGTIWRRLVSKNGAETRRGPGEQTESDPTNDLTVAAGDLVDDSGPVTVTYIPEAVQSVHPSDVLNRYLLSKEPSADVAVTHDAQWSILFDKGILTSEDLGDDSRLESILSERCRLVSQDGVVSLQTLGDFSVRLLDIDEAVRAAWKDDELDDAEELLSRQIIRRKGSDHSAFAHRALIRARLHRWDAALRDAQTANDIQPSVAARVAEGFALFGQQKYALAVNAFNYALRECDTRDKILVSLIKSIVLFEVGYHAEGMADLADLIEHCPADVKSVCSVAQTKMYIQLAILAINKQDHDKGLRLLAHAQSHRPFPVVSEAGVVSLICGWKFDNLQFSIYQEECEALYAAGRLHEAAELLSELTRNLGEDIRATKDNTSWTTTFTERCLKSLESLGDSALALQSYTEAISHYSVTLNLAPTIRDNILVKRSMAYAAAGIWNDALNDAEEAIILNPHSPWGYERKFAALRDMKRQDEAVQAFHDMLSSLERSVHYAWRQAMAIQRADHHGKATQHYSTHHNQDHRLSIELVMKAIQDVDSRRTTDILDRLRAERDEMVEERKAFHSGNPSDRLEQQPLAGILAQLPGSSSATSDEQTHAQTASEQHLKLYYQLSDIARQNQEDDKQTPETMKLMLRLAEHQLILRPQRDRQSNLPVFDFIDELRRYNAMQRELLDVLSGYWKDTGGPGGKGKQQERESGDDREELHYIFRSLREDFIDALATEAQTIVNEVANLGEKRCRLQQELGQLMTMKAKYGPGGEFDPEWKPRVVRPPPQQKVTKIYSQKESTRLAVPSLPNRAISTGTENTQYNRPGWRSVAPTVNQRPLSIRPETGSFKFGLLGPPTPLMTRTSFTDVKPGLEPNTNFTEMASGPGVTERPVSLSETLPLHPEHAQSESVSSSQPSMSRDSPRREPSWP